MALKTEEKVDNVSYRSNPLQFCQDAYARARKHNEEFRANIVENIEFYEGRDKELEARANDPDVKRSSLYIHQSRPTIDTRISGALDRMEEDDEVVKVNVPDALKNAKDEEGNPVISEERLDDCQKELNENLKKSGYLYTEFINQFMGAEFAPGSWIKIVYEDEFENKPKALHFGDKEWFQYVLRHRRLPPEGKIVWDYTPIGKQFTIKWLGWDEFLYDPQAASLDESGYCIHCKWLTWNELVENARLMGYDEKKIRIHKESGDDEKATETIAEEVDTSDAVKPAIGYREGKYLLCEFWIRTYKENGEPQIRNVVVLKNKEIIANESTPYFGVRYPFVDYRAHLQIGKMEGIATMSLLRPAQKLYNDYFNALNDAMTYGLFPPLITPPGQTFKKQLRWGPGALWEGVEAKPLQIDLGAIRLVPQMIEKIEAIIRQVGNAPDFDQATDPGSDEKATKTRLRAAGASKRFRPTAKALADLLTKIGHIMIKMMQQDDEKWILPGNFEWVLTVPVLSGVYTPDEERQEKLVLMESLSRSPVYEGPIGVLKLRKMVEDVLKVFRVPNTEMRIPSEQELMAQNEILTQIQQLAEEMEAEEKTSGQPSKPAAGG